MSKANTVISVINTFLRRKSIDRIGNKLRAEVPTSMITSMKTIQEGTIKKRVPNPYDVGGLEKLTQVQRLTREFCKNDTFRKNGSVAIEASCGSGKTLAALYLMYHFKCKTLIISTRNAVIDQWARTIQHLFPELILQTNEKRIFNDDADVWILTPQYMNMKNRVEDNTELNIHPGIIIYDEIHTMISETSTSHEAEFLNVLKYPFIRCINGDWNELPYMVGLSATYPERLKVINRIFGPVNEAIDTSAMSITRIPIHICDMRDFETSKTRQKCDLKYVPIGETSTIEYYIDHIQFIRDGIPVNKPISRDPLEDKHVPEFMNISLSPRNQGIVMVSKIDISVWAALFIHKRLRCSILLVRTADEDSYFIDGDKHQDFQFTKSISLSESSSSSSSSSIQCGFFPLPFFFFCIFFTS